MNWQKDKLTIIGFGIIFVILGIFGYLLWDMNKEPMAEVSVTESTPAPVTDNKDPKVVDPEPVEENEKSKVKIYTEQVKVDESGDNWDVKVLRTINDSDPELLTTLELRDALVSQFVPYNVELSPDRKNLLIWYEDAYDGSGSRSYKLQLFNIETKATRDILVSKSGFNIVYPIFSPNSKEVFFLRYKYKSNDRDKTYDFYLYNTESQKNEIIKTITTRSGISNPLWLSDNKILLSYSLETTIENPSFRQEFYVFNKDNKTISAFPNQKFSLLSERIDLFNTDNTLFTSPKTFTTKEFEKCYDDAGTLPNSYTIIETMSGKEITSFKGAPEEPVLPVKFSPDNKEILYRLAGEGCNVNDNVKYYVQSLYEDKPREEVNIDDIIQKWDIIFNVYNLGAREIIFYQ